MKEIIKVQGKWYNLLAIYSGRCYLSKLTDIKNDIVKDGVIWEMQPFFYENEKWYGNLLKKWALIIRWFKKSL
jgi:hypothetical protein